MNKHTALRNIGYDFELLDGEDNEDGTKGRIRTRIHCSACENDCIITTGNGGLSVEWAQRRFRNKGWALGKSRDLDLCPECMKGIGGAKGARARHALGRGLELMNSVSGEAAMTAAAQTTAQAIVCQGLSEKQITAVFNTLDEDELNARLTPTEKKMTTNIVSMVATEPPKMGRDERRLVFEKLNEHYVSEAVGYGDGWSDKKIAEELGCPRKWVEDVREEMFGPVKVNNEAKNFVERIAALDHKIFEAKAQMAAAEKTFDDIASAMKTAEGAFRAVLGEFEALKKLAKQIEKLY
jgi:hypothetical protein